MRDLYYRSLLVLVLCITLIPTVVSAGSEGVGEVQPQSAVNDPISGQTPSILLAPDNKFQDMAPAAGSSPESSGDTGSQTSKTSPAAHKEQVKVVYDQETEKDRGTLITLIIAFGISLALNIYLATSLISARSEKSYSRRH